jgi:hypothetical protein
MRARARERAQRGARWLLALQEPDGSLRGATALDAYYKGPCALAFAGHRAEAERLFDFAAQRFLKSGGDLDGSGVTWFDRFRIYPHAWLLWGAVELGRSEAVQALAGHLESQWNPETGGFRADAGGTEEIMTTSMAGLAMLRAGRIEIARQAGAWLESMLDAQPDLRRGLVHVWKPGVGLTEGDGSVWFRVNAAEPRQWYFQYGIAAALLAALSKHGGDEARWLELARRYLHASAHCYEDRYRTPQSGKIGWGAAWTYALSGRAEDEALVAAVEKGLCDLQGGDGSWNGEGVYDASPAPESAVARIDVTSEFVALLSMMSE